MMYLYLYLVMALWWFMFRREVFTDLYTYASRKADLAFALIWPIWMVVVFFQMLWNNVWDWLEG